MTTRRRAVNDAMARFRAAGIETARLDAQILLCHALDVRREALISEPEQEMSAGESAKFADLVRRRESREPVSHLLGQREFWSLPFRVNADVLDPRSDSETLVAAALDAVPDRNAAIRVLDLGTGSGCLLLALLRELPNAVGLGVDVSAEALLVAADNAERLGLGGRARFRPGNWAEGISERFHLIVSNPPYIPDAEIDRLAPEVARFEPRLALSGGVDGLEAYRQLSNHARPRLYESGTFAVEIGVDQAKAVTGLFEAKELRLGQIGRDLAGIARCLVFRAEGRIAVN
ncbi:MAG TPA: peptide chain release factor N(5)-glutamine methyltransferase [Candidatus Cybelea sp.]|nr:peptide chain release factor N(5)-glutamine methyltransferase [Candidatus Cybelea sp.]